MSERDDLYAAILADPDSDEPRLVYADALQAAGDPRGELIAIQCELARLGCDRTRLALWDPPSNSRLTHAGAAAAPRTRLAVLDVNQLSAHGRAELAFLGTRVLVGSRLPR